MNQNGFPAGTRGTCPGLNFNLKSGELLTLDTISVPGSVPPTKVKGGDFNLQYELKLNDPVSISLNEANPCHKPVDTVVNGGFISTHVVLGSLGTP